jgi:hypothetical protein
MRFFGFNLSDLILGEDTMRPTRNRLSENDTRLKLLDLGSMAVSTWSLQTVWTLVPLTVIVTGARAEVLRAFLDDHIDRLCNNHAETQNNRADPIAIMGKLGQHRC